MSDDQTGPGQNTGTRDTSLEVCPVCPGLDVPGTRGTVPGHVPSVPVVILHARLHALRRSALARLGEANQLDSGMLRLVADTGAALAAIDAEAVEAVPLSPSNWALVVDDNVSVRIVVYAVDRQCAAATLSPAAAVRLAGQLISCAVRRL